MSALTSSDVASLKHQLKAWEKAFRQREGRDPEKSDMKADKDIGALRRPPPPLPPPMALMIELVLWSSRQVCGVQPGQDRRPHRTFQESLLFRSSCKKNGAQWTWSRGTDHSAKGHFKPNVCQGQSARSGTTTRSRSRGRSRSGGKQARLDYGLRARQLAEQASPAHSCSFASQIDLQGHWRRDDRLAFFGRRVRRPLRSWR